MVRIYTSKNFSKFSYNYFPTFEARVLTKKMISHIQIFLLFYSAAGFLIGILYTLYIYAARYVALSDGFTCVIRSTNGGGATSSTLLADR